MANTILYEDKASQRERLYRVANRLVILCYLGFGGLATRRKREPIRGLWEREPGSDIWWIRYRVDGVLKREKVGSWSAAKDLLNKHRNEIREGIKMPENMRQTAVRFKTLCDDILVFSKEHHRDYRSVLCRVGPEECGSWRFFHLFRRLSLTLCLL